VCACVGVYGVVMACVCLCGLVLDGVGMYGVVWACMGLCGLMCILFLEKKTKIIFFF
jgi:hypothetical protein